MCFERKRSLSDQNNTGHIMVTCSETACRNLSYFILTIKVAFLWEDPDKDLRSKIPQMTVHKRNGILDELREFKKVCYLRLV